LIALLGLLPMGAAHAGCHLGRAEVPVTMIGLRPTIVAKINGTDTTFIVDSGAFYSTLSPAKAAELKLRLGPPPFNLTMNGIGGSADVSVARVKELTIFNVKVPNVEFIVGGSEPGSGVSGLLGQNFLRIADIEYDLANGVIRLVRPQGCGKAALAYWATPEQPISAMDIDWATPAEPHTTGMAELNGARIRVVFDTGAATSFVSLRAAERAGIKVDQPGVTFAGLSHGIGSRPVKTWVAPFSSFKIGGEEIRNTRLRIGEFSLSVGDMLIGADFFLSHRIYVASSQRKLYFTYNGGPVFNLNKLPAAVTASSASSADSSNPDAAAQAGSAATGPAGTAAAPTGTAAAPTGTATAPTGSSAAAQTGMAATAAATPTGMATAPAGAAATASTSEAAPAATSPDDPKDAAGFSRRGVAFAARRDFGHAIADLTRACELDPNEPSYFYERGQARLHNAQPLLAAADFDQALKLKPDDVATLLARAQLRLAANDRSGALGDLDVAEKAASKQADARFEIGGLYGRAGEFKQAVEQYDQWIPTHREDARMADALSNRGWARTLASEDPDKALADANAAVRLRPHEPHFLGRRALAQLRVGNVDKAIADWDAVVVAQPKNAWALYGRGVAKMRKGKTAEGQADISAATSLEPKVVDIARKQGLAP
jgi:tetratricopeptide (TPR) repeat protein/predicted aspartyl protease